MESIKIGHRFCLIKKLFDQEVPLSHRSSTSFSKLEKETQSQTALQKEGLLSKIRCMCDEI